MYMALCQQSVSFYLALGESSCFLDTQANFLVFVPEIHHCRGVF